MEDTLYIRPIQPDDLAQLLPLCQEHAEYEGAVVQKGDQIQQWRSVFFDAPPQLFGWVCCNSKTPTALEGYMTASIQCATWAAEPYVLLDCIYLRPQARRNGLGTSMLTLLREFAGKHGCREIQWQTILRNKKAASFYQSLGALPVKKLRWSWSVICQ